MQANQLIDEIMADVNLRWLETDRMTWEDSRQIRELLNRHLAGKIVVDMERVIKFKRDILNPDNKNSLYDCIAFADELLPPNK